MKAPLFIVGCPRSGTTLLYHMLLSSGVFAEFRKETQLYELVIPRFGNLRTAESRQQFLDEWLSSYFSNVRGFDVKPLIIESAHNCRDGGHFLRLLMDGIAEVQQVDRWMEATPTHVVHMERIKGDFPDARFVHVIRDGRDSALSLERQRWIEPFPWDRRRTLAVAALYWEWMVRRGRASGRQMADDYFEVRYESLIAEPRQTFEQVAAFIGEPLDYELVQRTALGTLSTPNTSFKEKLAQGEFNPVGRWRVECSSEEIRTCERVVGAMLDELGYPLAEPRQRTGPRSIAMRGLYIPYFEAKRWLKSRTPLGRVMVDASWATQRSGGRTCSERSSLAS